MGGWTAAGWWPRHPKVKDAGARTFTGNGKQSLVVFTPAVASRREFYCLAVRTMLVGNGR